MQIVIELSDDTYKDIKEENSIYGTNNGLSTRITGKVVGAIQNGTPLPKVHGRLIDADKLLVHKMYGIFGKAGYKTEAVYVDDINDAPTIIEADKERSE